MSKEGMEGLKSEAKHEELLHINEDVITDWGNNLGKSPVTRHHPARMSHKKRQLWVEWEGSMVPSVSGTVGKKETLVLCRGRKKAVRKRCSRI